MRTKAELEYAIFTRKLATVESLTERELSEREIRQMPTVVLEWHLQNNARNVEKAANAERLKEENRKNAETASIMRMHNNEATEEETKSAVEEVKIFCAAFPQFIGSYMPNREALISWLKEKTLPITAKNLETAFQALGVQGKILLNPKAIGIGTESEVSGHRLKTHPQLHRLLEPAPTAEQREKIEQRKMSAADWKDAHKEDFRETRVSDFQQRSWDQAIATFLLSNPTYEATDSNRIKILEFIKSNGLQINPQGLQAAFNFLVPRGELELNEGNKIEGQATRYTNLGGSPPGFPPKSDKYSFQKKVNSMGSKEYLDRINNDSAFREAVNALG
jgi:hypothetical protein